MVTVARFGLIAVAALAGAAASAQDPDLVARARAIHERVITLDTHNDIDPGNFTRGCNYTMPLTTQVNLPKMKAGGLDVSFMIVYVGQSNPPQVADAFQPAGYDRAYKSAVAKFDAIHHLTEEIAPNEIGLALTAGRRGPHLEERQEGGGDRHRERLSDRHRRQPRQGVLAARRTLHVAGAQRPQSARGFQHRRGRQQVVVGRAVAARPPGDSGDEQVGHHGRRLAPVEGRR